MAVLYIDLQQERADDSGRGIMAAVPSERYPVIRSAHSDFDTFLSSLPHLTSQLNDLVARASQALSDRNLLSLNRMIGNLDKATASLPQSAQDVQALIADLRSSIRQANLVIGDIHAATGTASADIVAAVQKLRNTSANLERATAQLNAFISENRDPLSGFVQQGLPQIEALLRDSRAAAQELGALSRSLRDNPSRLIYQPAPSGVAIPP